MRAPTSYQDLRTVNGQHYPTFKDACKALGLLEDDTEYIKCLEEAAVMQTGSALCSLFGTMMIHGTPTDTVKLWDQFKAQICDDLGHALRQRGIPEPTPEQIYDYGLYLLHHILLKGGYNMESLPNELKHTQPWQEHAHDNHYISAQLDYDHDQLRDLVQHNEPLLNASQKHAYHTILQAVQQGTANIFFLEGPAGTGKTFVYQTLAAAIRSAGDIVLCVASSGIASLLLPGGRTSHSMFKIPINCTEDSTCSVKKNSLLAALFKLVKLIIWDEVPMQHCYQPEAVDRTLQDICDSDQPFGGIPVVFGGDFQQTLPVITKGSREQIVSASPTRSALWKKSTVLHLQENMRLADEPDFAQWLLDIGHGRNLTEDHLLKLRDGMDCGQEPAQLIQAIYGDIAQRGTSAGNDNYYLDRTILSARNDDVDELNDLLMKDFPGTSTTYHSADSLAHEPGVDNEQGLLAYTPEYLNAINIPGLPMSKLILKEQVPLMLLRNIAPDRGLCNGTRVVLTHMRPHVLQVHLISGEHKGKVAFIPRLQLTPNEELLGFSFKRCQFPVRLAFAMTINKSQGQSVKHVGIDLRAGVFSHGQLYVAMSRATRSSNIKVILPPGAENLVKNIVYQEALLS